MALIGGARHGGVCALNELTGALTTQTNEDMLSGRKSQTLVARLEGEFVDAGVVRDAGNLDERGRLPFSF